MKKQLCFIVMSIVFVYIYSSYSCINEIKRKKYVQNTYEKINNNFSLERMTLKDETLSIYEYTTNSTGYLLCEGIEKLTWTNNFKYIIGYIELSKQGLCKGYFYINSNDEKDYKFNLTKKEVEEKFGKDKYKLVKENIINFENTVDFENNKNGSLYQADYIVCNFDTVNYLKDEKEFLKFIEKCNKNLKKDGFLIFDAVTEDIFEEIFENDIFLDEEPEYTSIWRHEKLSKRKHLIEIDLFIRENENDNLFRKYNEIQKKFIYDPEWIIKTVQNKGFEIFDTASNPEFGESRIFFILKKL